MSVVRMSVIQGAAHALTQIIHPITDGFMIVPLGPEPLPTVTVPAPRVPLETVFADPAFRILDGAPVLVIGIHWLMLDIAEAYAASVAAALTRADVQATAAVCGEWIRSSETPTDQRIGDVLATLPARAGLVPSEIETWASHRRPRFEPVASTAGDAGELRDQWLHAAVTGQEPDADMVARLGGAMAEGQRDELLLEVVRAAFDSLDESSDRTQIMLAIVRCDERPRTAPLKRGGLTAAFAAAHLADDTAAADLGAVAALLLWAAGAGNASAHAVDEAVHRDPANGFVRLVEKIQDIPATWTLR